MLIYQSIENENFEIFQQEFANYSKNFQQRKSLFHKIYLFQNPKFIQFIDNKISLSSQEIAPIIIETFAYSKKPILQEMFSKINDQSLFKHMSSSLLEHIFFQRDDQFLIKFLETYNLYSFREFKKMIYFSYKYQKEEFFNFLSKTIIPNKNFQLYIMLCAYKTKKMDFLNEFIYFHQDKNANFISDMKNFIQNYNLHKYVNPKEFKDFANKIFINSFSNYLEKKLIKHEPIITTHKKLKI
jgi:hypothetical protein